MPKAPTNETSFVNPASLSLPSTSDDMSSSPEPQPGPSRKRPRTEQSSEERKEARAHRNRIAAQNSRDRRKAQFSHLERRVAELEEENRQLRAGITMTPTVQPPTPVLVASAPLKSSADQARDRENEELKERIRTLEKGWDAVVKALAAQGLPTGIAPSSNTDSLSSIVPASSPITAPISPSSSSSATFSSTSASTSPLPSTVALSSASSVVSESSEVHQSTRHLARVATGRTPLPSLQRVNWPSTTPTVTISQPLILSRSPMTLKAHRQSTTLPWNPSSARSSLTANLRLSRRRLRSSSRFPQGVVRFVVSLNHKSPSRKRPPLLRRK
ncbi:hypothetical protein J3R30DRAFT_1837561 [Lentinula aciculospora]|uniref:X-box-binding protein 1 n=1 Tax=Lentinula aciculospora TaxID=153920 RepID=A0A9W9DTK7_9AGAR|nr:hypothetical protein J3R30DRAFT_1837561 [Lentinula aciculospora]